MLTHSGYVRTSKFWQNWRKRSEIFSKIYEGHIRIWFRSKNSKLSHACVPPNWPWWEELENFSKGRKNFLHFKVSTNEKRGGQNPASLDWSPLKPLTLKSPKESAQTPPSERPKTAQRTLPPPPETNNCSPITAQSHPLLGNNHWSQMTETGPARQLKAPHRTGPARTRTKTTARIVRRGNHRTTPLSTPLPSHQPTPSSKSLHEKYY
jgi:hypothetical protein